VTVRIAPSLFDFVDEAQEDLRAAAAMERPLRATSAIRQFYINFFVQFFENVLDAGIDTLSPRDAIRAGVLLKQRTSLSFPVRALVRRFQKLCKMDPDLRGADYGGGTAFFRSFHEEFVPAMLRDIATWAKDDGVAEIGERATTALNTYLATLDELAREADDKPR
jgi:hypothetical protein